VKCPSLAGVHARLNTRETWISSNSGAWIKLLMQCTAQSPPICFSWWIPMKDVESFSPSTGPAIAADGTPPPCASSSFFTSASEWITIPPRKRSACRRELTGQRRRAQRRTRSNTAPVRDATVVVCVSARIGRHRQSRLDDPSISDPFKRQPYPSIRRSVGSPYRLNRSSRIRTYTAFCTRAPGTQSRRGRKRRRCLGSNRTQTSPKTAQHRPAQQRPLTMQVLKHA